MQSVRIPFVIVPIIAGQCLAGADGETRWVQSLAPFVEEHCRDCHGSEAAEGGLDLDRLGTDLGNSEQRRHWVRVHDRVASGEMPPPDADAPDSQARRQFVRQLADSLLQADANREVVLRRLNRVEYENTMRDLFGVNVTVRDELPEDASAAGFDNIGEALAISAEQMQAYLDTADIVLDAVFGSDRAPETIHLKYPLSHDTAAHLGKLFLKTDDGVVLFSSGYCPSAFRTFRPKVAGTYRVRIQAKAFQSSKPVVMVVYGGDVIAGRRGRHFVGAYDVLPGDDWTVIEFTDFIRPYDSFHPVPYRLFHRANRRFHGAGLLIGEVEIEGPLEAWPPAGRAYVFGGIDPLSATREDLQPILTGILPDAFRRPTDPSEVAPYVALAEDALDQGRSFEDAIRVGLKAILCSPEFLFIDQTGKRALETGEDSPVPVGIALHTSTLLGEIDDFTLASRLSYFLWSSMPDRKLLELAAQGELHKSDVLREQVERMLQDPKAAAFTENFTGQWLSLRDIDFTEPDSKLYPEYDDVLRAAMLEETRAFFQEILEHDSSLLEFVDSDWTILNEPLARHYHMDTVKGQDFRRVQLEPTSVRGGVLTQASVLKVTANGTTTSPVLRGVWVLKNIIGQPTSPPPPDVPAIEPDIRGSTRIRDQLAKHRDNAACAACHARIDPPGFALESFDVTGRYRVWYRSLTRGIPVKNIYLDNIRLRRVLYRRAGNVDCTGTMLDGRSFKDIRAFKRLLIDDPDQIARCLTEKLLTYSLGRELGFSDRATVEGIVTAVREQDYGFRTLIHEIVQSGSFLQP